MKKQLHTVEVQQDLQAYVYGGWHSNQINVVNVYQELSMLISVYILISLLGRYTNKVILILNESVNRNLFLA